MGGILASVMLSYLSVSAYIGVHMYNKTALV